MSSLRRITASRSNAARSRGPITPDGKERSSANVHSSWFPGIGEMAAAYWRMRCAPAAAPPNHAVPNEPNPISEHQVVQVPDGPDVPRLTPPPDSRVSDLPVLNCG
jgi:hypothetical protein